MLRRVDQSLKPCNRDSLCNPRLTYAYDWFTEGFDTTDLKEANALFEEQK